MYKVLNFKEYINESISIDEIKYTAKTYKEILYGFRKLNYMFCGKYRFQSKSVNAFINAKNFERIFNAYYEMKKDILGTEDHYNYANLDVWHTEDKLKELIDEDYLDTVYNPDNKEKVIRFEENKYCFWNENIKYFYFIEFSKFDNFKLQTKEYFELWLKLKTTPKEELENELISIRDRRNRRIANKEAEIEAKNEINDISKEIYDDYQKNRENYKIIDSFDDLPENVKEELNRDNVIDVANGNYFEIGIKGGSDRYEVSLDTFIVNTRDLDDGYVYQMERNHAKRWTYWGD